MYENPLVAIPHHVRPMIRKQYGIAIEGEPSPKVAYLLENQYGNDFWQLPVKRVFLSEQNRVGIGTFQPGDTKSQSQSELVGSVNFAKLEEHGVESHPLAYNFDGELNVSNRGIMEFIEMLKVDPKFRYILLTLAQEKQIKVERFPLIYADLVPLAHTNETEYNKFLANKAAEALHDRLWVIKVPYNLCLDAEVKIYEKLICSTPGFQSIHIAPHTLSVAAMFATLSRLEEPKDKSITLLQKMHLYNNEDVDGFTKENVKDLKTSAEREGLDGVSPRYIVNRLAACFARHGITTITPIDAIRSIKEGLTTNAKLDKEEIARLENLISECVVEYNKVACNEVQKAFFVNFEHEIRNLLENYIDNVGCYLSDTKVENEWGDYEEPDERLMRGIEEKVDVSDSGKDTFREEIYRKMLESKSRIGKYDYQSHPRLKTALQKQLFAERSDVIRLTVSSRNPDPEGLKKLNEVVAVLCDKYGYNAASANELLRYVSNIMSKSS
jgi:serine protein kinase